MVRFIAQCKDTCRKRTLKTCCRLNEVCVHHCLVHTQCPPHCNEIIKHSGIIDVLSESENAAFSAAHFIPCTAQCTWLLAVSVFPQGFAISVFISTNNSTKPFNGWDALQFKIPTTKCKYFYIYNHSTQNCSQTRSSAFFIVCMSFMLL